MLRNIFLSSLVFLLFAGILSQTHAANGVKAPEWDVSEWLNGEGASLADLHGKVVVVEFFQMLCQGCNRFSIPLMKQWHETFRQEIDSGDLVLLSIHTVFELHDYQTPAHLRPFLKKKGIEHLVGIDRLLEAEGLPETMKRYATKGTPEMAFIDRQGMLRAQPFGAFEIKAGEQLIRTMLTEHDTGG
jgi:thiol-disulfide isomerase/thioredoxin